jgi:hypothetical protein
VIGALETRDCRPAREGSRRLDRKHDRFGPAADEAHLFHGRNALRQQLRKGDLVLLDCPAEHVPYRFGRNPVAVVLMGGRVVYVRPGQEWRLGSR